MKNSGSKVKGKVTFSLITVCYNNLPGLKATWDSISQQTLDFEWIVVDGNSSDGTKEFLQSLTDRRLRWVSEKDKGIYDAMNKGIGMCTQDYIIFVNSGDELADNNVLQVIRETALRNGSPDLIYGDSYEKTVTGALLHKKSRSHTKVYYGMFTHHQAMVYKRTAVKNIRYRLEYPIGADYAFTAELLTKGGSAVHVDIPICVFEQGGVSATSRNQGAADQWNIRRDILKMPLPKRLAIKGTQAFFYYFKKAFPDLYKKMRFSKGGSNQANLAARE